jgi:hypothetical protein
MAERQNLEPGPQPTRQHGRNQGRYPCMSPIHASRVARNDPPRSRSGELPFRRVPARVGSRSGRSSLGHVPARDVPARAPSRSGTFSPHRGPVSACIALPCSRSGASSLRLSLRRAPAPVSHRPIVFPRRVTGPRPSPPHWKTLSPRRGCSRSRRRHRSGRPSGRHRPSTRGRTAALDTRSDSTSTPSDAGRRRRPDVTASGADGGTGRRRGLDRPPPRIHSAHACAPPNQDRTRSRHAALHDRHQCPRTRILGVRGWHGCG